MSTHKRPLVFLVLIFGGALSNAQSIIRVDPNGPLGSGDGSTWGNAASLHGALNTHASSGDEIWVKAGTYKPHASDRTVYFALVSGGCTLYGGFDGDETSEGQRDPATNVTTLSGDIDTGGDDDSYTILYANYPGAGSYTIDGFTITGGRAFGDSPGTGLWETYGAAIYIAGLNGTLTLNDCIFDDNQASLGGGAVSVINSTTGVIVVTASTFTDNHAGFSAGALRIDTCDTVSIGGDDEGQECVFDGNTAISGGAVNIQKTTAVIERCEFTDNDAIGNAAEGGAIEAFDCNANSKYFSATDCTFDGNTVNDNVGGNGYGGAVGLKGYRNSEVGYAATFTRCDFLNNQASVHAAALWLYSEDLEENCQEPPCAINGTCYLGPVKIDTCTFVNNACNLNGEEEEAGLGGAIWSRNIELTCVNSEFDDNVSERGGGAIWFEAVILGDGTGSYPWVGDADLTLTGCTFRGNQMTSETAPDGGGAVFMDGMKTGSAATNLTATITNCKFIDNESDRGGGIYLHSTDEVEISDCTFVGNDGRKAGGGIGIGDPQDLRTTVTKICKSRFISNTSLRGGAIHNHEGAVSYMVNCYLTGNSSTKEGGGVFNSRHTGSAGAAELYMHNCLIAGNVASNGSDDSDVGGGVFSGLSGDLAVMEMVHCTLLGNYAGYRYGGAANVGGNSASVMLLRNSVTWSNEDAGSDDLDAQLYYSANTLGDDHVDHNVIDSLDLDPDRFEHSTNEVNTEDDPVFLDEGATTILWTAAVCDHDTGTVAFTVNDLETAAVGMLFKPRTDQVPMLVIKQIDVTGSRIIAWGCWPSFIPSSPMSGKLYDLHIDDSGSAYEFGDLNYYPDDVCNLAPGSKLTVDLDLEDRGETPEAGAYEVPE